MQVKTKLLKAELMLIRPFLTNSELEKVRFAQDEAGKLIKNRTVKFENVEFDKFNGCFTIPKSPRNSGVMLYLHGGGYTAGSMNYALGFGSTAAYRTKTKTFCAAYRLAPENPYPSALEDAFTAYTYLLDSGYKPKDIVLIGESAGGGLCFALCSYLKSKNMELPAGIIAISPWVDLTMSGSSYDYNADKDPLLTKDVLAYYAKCYAGNEDTKNPYISPLFADLTGFPDTLMFAGGDEMLKSDSYMMREKLIEHGCKCDLSICDEMWHAYVLYGTEETRSDYNRINDFIREHLE